MINLFIDTLRAAGKSKETISLRTYHLRRVQTWLKPTRLEDATPQQLVAFMASGKAWGREYRRSIRATIRLFYGWLSDSGQRADNPAAGLPAVKPQPPVPRPTPDRSYKAALADATPRVSLMIRLAAQAGLRRAEVARVETGDLVDDLLGYSLIVHGKGNKERLVPLPDDLARDVQRGLEGNRWLFPGLDPSKHLTPAHVGKLVSDQLPAGITMHSLRHRFATRVYASTHDLLTTQQLLGHSSPTTTQVYVQIDQAALRAAVRLAA